MSRQVYVHDEPQRCVVGTVGEPGQRTFFLQVRSGSRINSVVLEKEQARILAERLDGLLDEMIGPGEPGSGPGDDRPLDTPIEEDFRVGSLGLGWNAETRRLIVEAHAVSEDDTDVPDLESDDDGPDTVRIRLSPVQGREFARRTLAVVAAGRPPCPFCHLPLDPSGHICPRANGYRR
ncbi:MAG: DUF3090 family protein [Candidatus Nanopelagicales bacterium]